MLSMHTAGRGRESARLVSFHLNALEFKKEKYVRMRPKPKQLIPKSRRTEHGLLQDSHSFIRLSRHKRWKFMMLIYLCILQSTEERRLEMKTANNRQQYPGFACLRSDNNFNLPTEYIQFSLPPAYSIRSQWKCESSEQYEKSNSSFGRNIALCANRLWRN